MALPPDDALLALRLPRRAEAASAARKALASLNGDLHLVSEARLGDAQLLLTELVTNAVRHAQTDSVDLRVRATPQTLRVEVSNAGAEFTHADRGRPADQAGGWGLAIVDVVAHRWGIEPAGAGSLRVWFELDRPAAEAPIELEGDAPPPAPGRQPPTAPSTTRSHQDRGASGRAQASTAGTSGKRDGG